MYKVIVIDPAKNTLMDIVMYITDNLANKKAAKDFLDEVNSSYNNLASTPFMYSACPDERLKRQGYRRVVIKNYIMVYRVLERKKEVQISAFFYGGSNYENILIQSGGHCHE